MSIQKKSVHLAEQALYTILTTESSRTFFCAKNKGNWEITNESVQSMVLEKLRAILTDKLSRLDPDFKDIFSTKGVYKNYKHYLIIHECVEELSRIIKDSAYTIPHLAKSQLEALCLAHALVYQNKTLFKDAFAFDISVVKLYYVSIISSIIYAMGFIVTSLLSYEKRNGVIAYELIVKNADILERGLPKNMYATITQFNIDMNNKSVFKMVQVLKKTKAPAVAKMEQGTVLQYESPIMIAGAILFGIVALPALIRYVIYFFIHSKLRLSQYIAQQAYFLQLSARSLRHNQGNVKIIKKQEKFVENLKQFSAVLAGDKYIAEKKMETEIREENRNVVRSSDTEIQEQQNTSRGYDFKDSDILL